MLFRSQLAHSWQHDDSGKVWTVKIRSDLKWADDQALTASDVVHTLALMKKPEINSAISSSWQTITATAKDTTTVEFTLPAPLMSFDSALTFGVLPNHILEGKSAIEIANLSNKQLLILRSTIRSIRTQERNIDYPYYESNINTCTS